MCHIKTFWQVIIKGQMKSSFFFSSLSSSSFISNSYEKVYSDDWLSPWLSWLCFSLWLGDRGLERRLGL